MANTYEFLLRRKADLEVRMIEAQRRAQEPFEGELKAIGVALGALERAGLAAPGEPASFAAPPRRGRKPRAARDMILMVLGREGAAMTAPEIVRQLERRWNRALPLAAVLLELQGLETDHRVRRDGPGWVALDAEEAA
ncbi:hypothetical protein [Caulobacter endophyticus]|uniref:hypothetical protein n=1 Tax=Caulobacter endophyticus TaxID=2172652 RepID=UPI00240F5171|nr:hypothetical protein [Caulobacter endophyticus]MDG2531944.1 hypothetical protein [Caulobacter endophyticus]